MKKQLLLLSGLFCMYILNAQSLQPILTEIYDPGVNDRIQFTSSAVDENNNTFLSMRSGNAYSGIMKLGPSGNIIWQKKLPYLYTELIREYYYYAHDAQNLTYKQGDGLYLSTQQYVSFMGSWTAVDFYISKANPSNGSFAWHYSCKAEHDVMNRSMVLDAPNGVYWLFANKIINLSPSGYPYFKKSLAPHNVITAATKAPGGGCFLLTHNSTTQKTDVLRMNAAGAITRSFTISDTSYIFNIYGESFSKMEYHSGNIYLSFGRDAGSGLVKMDTLGNISTVKKWRYDLPSVAMSFKGGTWTIYNNKIVFSHGGANGPIQSFARLNLFTQLDLNLNELQTFAIPHFATYGTNSFSGTDLYYPEIFSKNGPYLQVAGSKGDNPLRNGNFIRLDSSFIFKNCMNVMQGPLPNVSPLTVFINTDTLATFATNDTVNNFFPLSNNTPYTTQRNDLVISSVQTTSGFCGECNSTALANVSGEVAVIYYNWGVASGGQTSNPAVNLCPGTYNLTISDNYGCSDNTTFQIQTAPPVNSTICLTTVDSMSTHNILVWEKPASDVIEGFNIYREITANNFQFIAFVSYDSLSEYHDLTSNPNITNFRYKITTVDTCGFESSVSDYHSTIHLQLLGNGNMQWTLYDIESQGNPVSFYNVYRDNNGTGTWTLLTSSLPGTNSTYTDIDYALYPNAKYRVDVNWGISCTPTRATINTTRSNIKSSALIGVEESDINNQITVYPNPANNFIVIQQNQLTKAGTIAIIDALGQTILILNSSNATEKINLENLAKGVYTVSVQTQSGNVFKKLVIQ